MGGLVTAGTQKSEVSSATFAFSLTSEVSHSSLFSPRVEVVEELPSERVDSGVTQDDPTHVHLYSRGGIQGAVGIG